MKVTKTMRVVTTARPMAVDLHGCSSTVLADNLRFLYVGQRARAESVVQQRQPGLIETLVRQQIHITAWQEDIGRMLFQLMVPHDFKDAARQLDRVVLVVDSYTANLPWELMLADDPNRGGEKSRPLAVRTPVVRQLSSTRFRRQVRQAIARTALVIGNPSVDGFRSRIPWTQVATQANDSSRCPEAETEAEAVADLLERPGLQRPAASHRRRPDGQRRARGALPPAVSCSAHLGARRVRPAASRRAPSQRRGALRRPAHHRRRDRGDGDRARARLPQLLPPRLSRCTGGRDGNKLAASIARELIEIGVRCVIVAGWAVNDE